MSSSSISQSDCSIQIEGITNASVIRYFETLNAGQFQATASLFSLSGVLEAPFEDAIQGQAAIATYLESEAAGMRLEPKKGESQTLENKNLQIQVFGKVHTRLFSINVGWQFIINPQHEIEVATIKLLASPAELLSIRPAMGNS
ncbi:MAG: ketosteroid isomerase family protein [Microcoleaceae cyanobacterium]